MKTALLRLVPALALLAAGGACRAESPASGLRLPPGFEATEFADSLLANDIFCMTIDPQGRVIVSGRGYIRILVDEAGRGRATRAVEFAGGPKDGAQGLWWEGDSLYFTGDGGLRRYRDRDGDGRADGPSELIRALRTGGEHEAHAIRRGPDGWLYLLCGNGTGIDRTFATLPTSPIREPVAGCVLRFAPEGKGCEIVADGFRNPYGMDFNGDGELFTFDSDNERCVSLPWYEPTRLYRVVPGGHYGWQAPQHAETWRFPPYFADVVAPLLTLGRGSPTGVVCYRHTQFPEHYRGGLFLLDWTFGRVYFVTLKRAGASWACEPEVFLQSAGDNGFAPTAAAVHPRTGDLYVSIGGRGTRGAVYRIRYTPGYRENAAEPSPLPPRSLDWREGGGRKLFERIRGGDALDRRRALDLLYRHRSHFSPWQLAQAVRAVWDDPDRSTRQAAARLVAVLDEDARQELEGRVKTGPVEVTFCLGSRAEDPAGVLGRAGRLLADRSADPETRLAGVRLTQLALGDLMDPRRRGTVWEGYSPRDTPLPLRAREPELFARAAAGLREAFPSGQADLDREVSRTLAVIEDEDPATTRKVAGRVTPSSDPVEDVHYLIVLARLQGPRTEEVTRCTAEGLLALDRKLDGLHRNRDRNWPLRVAELHAELARKDPALNDALLASKEFGRPDHALFARCPGFDRRRAARTFLARAESVEDYPWTPELVRLIEVLPEERVLPVLRSLWEKGGFEEEVLPALARRPREVDRDKFLGGLSSPRLGTVERCLEALEKLPPPRGGEVLLTLVRALRRLPDGREAGPLRRRLGGYLARVSGRENLGGDREAWTRWLEKDHPDLAARLGGADGVDVAAWKRRLAGLDWPAGDAARGQEVFRRASCAACHSGAQSLGPDLQGVTGRFSRDDLFTAILQPSRDISPRYRTTFLATADGKVYQGMVIYEAVDSLILQTGPAATVRLVNQEITARRTTDTSLMPAGLLDRLSDREIEDLYAYLKGLGGPKEDPPGPAPKSAAKGG